MKTKVRISGLKTLAKSGSLVFCKNCEKILGSINPKGIKTINISLTCTCGTNGNLDISRTGELCSPQIVGRMPKVKKGVMVCEKCSTPLFGIIPDRVEAYSFFVRCICGECYDLKPNFLFRLGETLDMMNKKER